MAKMAVSELLASPKLISRKIWVIEKSWNFHTVPTVPPFYLVDAVEKFLMKGLLVASRSLIKADLSEVLEFHCTSGMGAEATTWNRPIKQITIAAICRLPSGGHFVKYRRSPCLVLLGIPSSASEATMPRSAHNIDLGSGQLGFLGRPKSFFLYVRHFRAEEEKKCCNIARRRDWCFIDILMGYDR